MMERFEDAQEGDLVYCRVRGCGEIVKVVQGNEYPIRATFETWKIPEHYMVTGKFGVNHVEATLFYRKCEERYLTERPEPEIDWATVAPGTLCMVKEREEEPEREREFLCFVEGVSWFKQINNISAYPWKYARIK